MIGWVQEFRSSYLIFKQGPIVLPCMEKNQMQDLRFSHPLSRLEHYLNQFVVSFSWLSSISWKGWGKLKKKPEESS